MLNADSLNQLRQLRSDIQAEKPLYPGTIKRITARFGFVTLDDGRDAYLPQEQAQLALTDDRVTVSLVENNKGKPTAELEKIDEQVLTTFIGQYQVRGKGHFAVPDVPGLSRWFFVPPKVRLDAKHGDFIRCRVSRHPYPSGNAQAEIVEIIGHADEPGIERSYALARYDLHDHWPETVEQEVAALSEDDIARQGADRADQTDRPYVTIDAPSTQDMDDAVYARPEGEGWFLAIAIADPVSLLPADGATEQEARQRASSGYFPGHPRAMMPPAISQDLGSLIPERDRLALVVEMTVRADGSLGDYQLVPALIRSRHKLSYDAVTAWLGGHADDTLKDADETVLNSLSHLGAVTTAMRDWRRDNALLNDDRPDYRIRLNEERKIRSLEKRYQSPANRLIEDAMIAANRCVADFLQQKGDPGLYITHGGVRQDRVDNIRQLLANHCPELADIDPSTPEGFMAIVRRAQDCTTDLPVKSIMLRQLERAELATAASAHQGMGLPAYTTMTSPLRKYSDYFVHRLVLGHLGQAPMPEWDEQTLAAVQQSLRHLRQAVNAMEQALKCQFAPSLGNTTLEGEIVQVNPAGFQVRLDETGLVGFVSARDLKQKFSFDPITLRLSNGDQQFQLEQRVQVRFREIDRERDQIRFELVQEPASNAS